MCFEYALGARYILGGMGERERERGGGGGEWWGGREEGEERREKIEERRERGERLSTSECARC
jgi:hypothetical protein